MPVLKIQTVKLLFICFSSWLKSLSMTHWGVFSVNIRRISKTPNDSKLLRLHGLEAWRFPFLMPEGETHPFDIRHIKCHLIAGTAVSRCGFILFLPASLWVPLTPSLKNGESFLFTLHGKQTILQLAEECGQCHKQTALNGLGGVLQTFSPFVSRKGFCYYFYSCASRSMSCVWCPQ